MQKRISAPKTYGVLRKVKVWISEVRPGAHKKLNSIPLLVLIRDILKITRTSSEAGKALNNGEVLIDGVPRKDKRFTIGFMDVISIPKIKKHYRITYDKAGRIIVKEIKAKESELKLVMIKRKIKLSDGFQLVTHDGRTIKVGKTEGRKYKTGSTLMIKVPSQEIVNNFPRDKGSSVFIIGGKHIGSKAQIKDSRIFKASKENLVTIKVGDKDYETVEGYTFPLGKDNEVTV